MGWFSKILGRSDGIPASDSTPLSTRVRDLEHEIKCLRLEWLETYDKVSAALDRQRKRQKVADADPTGPNGKEGQLEPKKLDQMSQLELLRYARDRGILQ